VCVHAHTASASVSHRAASPVRRGRVRTRARAHTHAHTHAHTGSCTCTHWQELEDFIVDLRSNRVLGEKAGSPTSEVLTYPLQTARGYGAPLAGVPWSAVLSGTPSLPPSLGGPPARELPEKVAPRELGVRELHRGARRVCVCVWEFALWARALKRPSVCARDGRVWSRARAHACACV
jgi:hypothetical protein